MVSIPLTEVMNPINPTWEEGMSSLLRERAYLLGREIAGNKVGFMNTQVGEGLRDGQTGPAQGIVVKKATPKKKKKRPRTIMVNCNSRKELPLRGLHHQV